MRTRYRRVVRARTLVRAVDLGFLAILVAWAQADVWAPQVTTPNSMLGDSRVLSITALAAGLALLARRRWPLASAVSVFGLLSIPAVLYGSSEGLGWFLLAGLALYSLGAHAALRPALLGVALYGVWSALLVTRDPMRHDLESVVKALLYSACLLPTWVIGIVVRNPRLRAVEWERRATRLERERYQAERDAVTKERSLIARELHDIVAHSVSMIVLQAEAGDSRLDSDTGAAHQAFHAIEGSARQSMGELRRLLGLLRVDDSTDDPLPQPRLAGVPALLETIRVAGLRATLEVSGDPIGLAPGLELNAYRIIQEALTNSLKHARASEVRVHVSYTPGAVELEITDDGPMSALPNGSGGQGLIGMRERALLHGGELQVSPLDSRGYRVWVRLPLESAR
jgi:signal transduction histidine kinase